MDGPMAAVGAPLRRSGSVALVSSLSAFVCRVSSLPQGSVEIFQGDINFEHTFTIFEPNGQSGSSFGSSVALSVPLLAVGAYEADDSDV